MPNAEREVTEEHGTLNPPVIPCFMRIDKRSKLTGPISQGGWIGFKIEWDDEKEGYVARKDRRFTLYILEDGYCEIPNLSENREKLEPMLKPIKHMKMKMQPTKDQEGRDIEVPVLDGNGKPVYTDEVAYEEPALFRKARGRRHFDPKEDTRVDLVRPWLRQFVQVPDAEMEPIPGED